MNMDEARPFIIRRKKIVKGHHGGSWKIALADFMTALMALFLVLWLLSTRTGEELEGVAEYFRTPLLVAMAGGDRPTSSSSAIPGGGEDPIHDDGEVARITLKQFNRPAEIQRSFNQIRREILQSIAADPQLLQLREQLRIYEVPEGLLIQLLDSDKRPMFERGSDAVEPYMRRLLRTLGPILNNQVGRISISGHTDSLPYAGENPDYSNWELSTDRANASRRELMAGGLRGNMLVRIVGRADKYPILGIAPDDPVNRRIELMVLDETVMTGPGIDSVRPNIELPFD